MAWQHCNVQPPVHWELIVCDEYLPTRVQRTWQLPARALRVRGSLVASADRVGLGASPSATRLRPARRRRRRTPSLRDSHPWRGVGLGGWGGGVPGGMYSRKMGAAPCVTVSLPAYAGWSGKRRWFWRWDRRRQPSSHRIADAQVRQGDHTQAGLRTSRARKAGNRTLPGRP